MSAMYTQLGRLMEISSGLSGGEPWSINDVCHGSGLENGSMYGIYFEILCLDSHFLIQCNSFLTGLHLLLSSNVVPCFCHQSCLFPKHKSGHNILHWSHLRIFYLFSECRTPQQGYKTISDLIPPLAQHPQPYLQPHQERIAKCTTPNSLPKIFYSSCIHCHICELFPHHLQVELISSLSPQHPI